MFNFNTDLADERRDIFRKANNLEEIPGIETETIEEEVKTEDKSTIDKSLEGFINNKEDIIAEYGNMTFSTYTSLILSNSDTKDSLLGDNKSQVTEPNGIIIGTCLNKAESIDKMTTTMNLLIIISYLERTILL